MTPAEQGQERQSAAQIAQANIEAAKEQARGKAQLVIFRCPNGHVREADHHHGDPPYCPECDAEGDRLPMDRLLVVPASQAREYEREEPALCPDLDCTGELHAEWWYRCDGCKRLIAPRAVDDDPESVRVAVPADQSEKP